MTIKFAIILTICLSVINNIWFKVQIDKEKKIETNWVLGTYIGGTILICLVLWTIYLFWFLGFKSALICIVVYLVLSYVLEKILGFSKITNLKKPWKK